MSERFTPIVVQAPQLSQQWFEARLGNVTGSKVTRTMDYKQPTISQMKIADAYYVLNSAKYSPEYAERLREYPIEYCIKAKIELAPNGARETYKRQTVSERISGVSSDEGMFTTKAMLWGQMQERHAKASYKTITQNRVQDSPLMLHPTLMCGASPDGLVIDVQTGELGNLEAKCLEPWNHLYKIIKADKVPEEYIPQIQMQMWIDGRDWCDFVGYDPRVKEGLRVFIKRVERDEFYIDEVLVPNITRFLDECDQDQRQFYAILKKRVSEAEEKFSSHMKLGLVVV